MLVSMSIYLVLLPLLSLIIWVIPPFVIKAIYNRRYQVLNEAIKRRDLAIRAIVKNPDEYASIGQVERVTDLIGELKEQITQEDSVLIEISSKLEQTQRYVEEQERNTVTQLAADNSDLAKSSAVDATPQPSVSDRIIQLNKEKLDALSSLKEEIEGSLSLLTSTPSLQSLESEKDKGQIDLLRHTLETAKVALVRVSGSVEAA